MKVIAVHDRQRLAESAKSNRLPLQLAGNSALDKELRCFQLPADRVLSVHAPALIIQ